MDNLSNISVIKDVLARHNFTFSKALGQNFLVNPSVCPKIAEMGNAKKGFGIIEIGTGIGVLTNELAKRADKVVAIEIDDRLMPVLAETHAEYDNVKIINADVMEPDLHKLIAEEFQGMDVAVCANLPYYITSPILMMLLEERLPIKSVTVMVQKEVAERMAARPGTKAYGPLSLAMQYYSEPKLAIPVPACDFMPAPKVDSMVVVCEKRESPIVNVDAALYFKVVRAAFSQRRKMLRTCLKSMVRPGDTAEAWMARAGIEPTRRGESLSIEEFGKLAESWKEE